MTTWTSKRFLLAGALLGLSACDTLPTLQPAIGFLDRVMTSGKKDVVALSQTQMAEGAFTLVPPGGFCLDRNTLRQDFALMARCDTLGVSRLAGGAPLGLITVSVSPLELSAPLPTAQEVAAATNLTELDSETSENDAYTFRASAAAPGAGLDPVHWRGVARIGSHVMGIAFYGPDGGRVSTPEGREIINSLIRKTRGASDT